MTLPDGRVLPASRWQPLTEHLTAVAHRARPFGRKLGAERWGWLAGLWHDLGKYHAGFQEMLREAANGSQPRRVDHSSAGAIHGARTLVSALGPRANAKQERLRLLLAAPIAAHHSGLPDGIDELDARLDAKHPLYEDVLTQRPRRRILHPLRKLPPVPLRLRDGTDVEWDLRLEFLLRLLLSAVVDADRLDAERITEGVLPEHRRLAPLRESYPTIHELRRTVDDYIDAKVSALSPERMSAVEMRVFDYRQIVLRACRAAAVETPGAFSLNVATGGGKTLSSLSFALRHADIHGKERVIVVIPYTSIIEQTAAEYREALGPLRHSLVEHHGAVDDGREHEERTPSLVERRRQLATENWDAPLIVTTSVQFFESLYGSSASKCRKLHNIADSVVVVDEAQTLPPELLNPTVWAINELVEGYGVTIMLSTATQPALESPFPEVANLRPVMPADVPSPPPRVRVQAAVDEARSWPDLAAELATDRQVLCITHRRQDARTLTLELDHEIGDETTIHLSALMCAAHRSERFAKIRERLAEGEICRVVSTQLVEVGVDLDFPGAGRSQGSRPVRARGLKLSSPVRIIRSRRVG